MVAKTRIGGASTSGHDLGFSQRRERGRGKRGGIENVLVTAVPCSSGGERLRRRRREHGERTLTAPRGRTPVASCRGLRAA